MGSAITNMKKYTILFIIAVLLLNLPPMNLVLGPDDVSYSNNNGTFTFDESNASGRDYDLCIENFEAFKSAKHRDTILYRITAINLLKFWRWGIYFVDDKYKLPYKSWEDIERIRGPIQNKTAWQSF
jgi:hypothetical protein